MIDIIFKFGSENVFVRVQDINVFFRTQQSQVYATIDGLKLDKGGVIKEHPDLKDREDWKAEAILRFKHKIKKMNNEQERVKYVIEELGKFGYIPYIIQKQGFRPVKL